MLSRKRAARSVALVHVATQVLLAQHPAAFPLKRAAVLLVAARHVLPGQPHCAPRCADVPVATSQLQRGVRRRRAAFFAWPLLLVVPHAAAQEPISQKELEKVAQGAFRAAAYLPAPLPHGAASSERMIPRMLLQFQRGDSPAAPASRAVRAYPYRESAAHSALCLEQPAAQEPQHYGRIYVPPQRQLVPSMR